MENTLIQSVGVASSVLDLGALRETRSVSMGENTCGQQFRGVLWESSGRNEEPSHDSNFVPLDALGNEESVGDSGSLPSRSPELHGELFEQVGGGTQ